MSEARLKRKESVCRFIERKKRRTWLMTRNECFTFCPARKSCSCGTSQRSSSSRSRNGTITQSSCSRNLGPLKELYGRKEDSPLEALVCVEDSKDKEEREKAGEEERPPESRGSTLTNPHPRRICSQRRFPSRTTTRY